jgi:predicted nucleic acid-binding protein
VGSTLVDSNVLIDVISGDERWEDWSAAALSAVAATGSPAINQMIYSEISIGFARVESCDSALDSLRLERLQLPWSAAFLAGKAFRQYRRRGGKRRSALPDFFIGAHAAVTGLPLLTRDARRYRTYFPTLELLTPP